MLIAIPRNLAALGRLAAKDMNGKFAAMTGVKLRDQGDGLYRAEATDGRVLGIISGPFAEITADSEPPPFNSPSTGASMIVQAAEFTKAITRIKPMRYSKPPIDENHVAFVGDPESHRAAVFGHGQSTVLPELEGKFPDTDVVLPRRAPMLRFKVDPKHMIHLLEAASAVNGAQVEILYYSRTTPLGVIACDFDNGQCFDGLIVPLQPAEEVQPKRQDPPPAVDEEGGDE